MSLSVSMQASVQTKPVQPRPAGAQEAAAPSPESVRPATPEAPKANKEQLDQAIQAVSKFTQPLANNLQFSIDEETGIKMVKVIDSATKEVIRQIPSEEMMEIARALDRLQGILLKQKA